MRPTMADILKINLTKAVGQDTNELFNKVNKHLRSNKHNTIEKSDFALLLCEIATNSTLKTAKIVLYNFLAQQNKV